MKTICFVVPSFPALTKTFVTNQIVEVKARGYRVIILTHLLNGLEKTSQEHIIEENDLLSDVEVIDYNIPNNKVLRFLIGLPSIVRYFKFWLKTPRVSIKHRFINLPYLLSFYAKFRSVDVFHVQFINSGQGVAEMKENGLLKGKLITTFHGYDTHYEDEDALNFFQNRYIVLFNESQFLTINTSYLVGKIMALGANKDKIRIVPMGIDTTFFKNKKQKTLQKSKSIYLISVGRLIELKGYAYAIKSVKQLVEAGYDVKYTIVGEGKTEKELNDLISSLNLGDRVFLVGNKNQLEIRDLLDESHIFLMSSITDSSGRAEAQGVVTAEAQAMSLPVVAFSSGGVVDTLLDKKTGLLVPEKDIDAYAKAIEALINNLEKYKHFSFEARKFAESNFSNKIMAERFMALYDS